MSLTPTKVLLVEDDPIQARLVREFLLRHPRHPFEVALARSLAEALQALKQSPPDVVLLDLTLPDSSDRETFLQVQRQAPELPVVVLTGNEDDELGTALVNAGAQDYLVKNEIGASVVARTLRYAIERKRAILERERLVQDLQKALAEVNTLSGLLPICAHCKKVRDDHGYWTQIERYISLRSKANFSHGLCPDCIKIYFPDVAEDLDDKAAEAGKKV